MDNETTDNNFKNVSHFSFGIALLHKLCAWFPEFAVTVGISTALVLANPFNIIDTLADKSVEVVLSAMAPLYPFPPKLDEEKNAKIIVVNFTDEDMRNVSLSQRGVWPPDLSGYVRLLKKISLHPPKSLFIDLFIGAHNRENQQELNMRLERMKKEIPVFVATLPSQTTGVERSEIAANPAFISAITDLVPGAWAGHGGDYPLVAADPCHPNREVLSPAARLWLENGDMPTETHTDTVGDRHLKQELHDVLDRAGPDRSGAACDRPNSEPGTHPAIPDMVVRWASTLPSNPGRPYLDAQGCGPLTGTRLFQRIANAAGLMMRGLSTEESRNHYWTQVTPCPHHTAVGVTDLFNIIDDDEKRGCQRSESCFLSGSILIIGADITGVNDTHQSLVHGVLPATLWHAMALDNLLEFGDHYLKRKPHLWDKFLEAFFELSIMVASAFIARSPIEFIVEKVKVSDHKKALILPSEEEASQELIGKGFSVTFSMALLMVVTTVIFVAFGMAAATDSFPPIMGLAVFLPLTVGGLSVVVLNSDSAIEFLSMLRKNSPRLFAIVLLFLGAFGAVGAFASLLFFSFVVEFFFMGAGWAPTLWLPLILVSMATVFVMPIKEPILMIISGKIP